MKKKEHKLLFAAAVTAVCACIVSFLPVTSRTKLPKAFQSALLSPTHKDEISRVTIAAPNGDMLTLSKTGAVWTVSDGESTAPASKKTVETLLYNSTRIRKLYKIADSAEKIGKRVSFYTLTFGNYAILHVYPTASLSNRIALASESKPIVYETEDDLSAYCTTELSAFADEHLFWGIQTVVSAAARFQSDATEEQKAAYIRKTETDAGFADFAAKLLSLRHGTILPLHKERSTESLPVSAEITLSDASARTVTMTLYKQESENSLSYLCTARYTPSPADTAEEQKAMQAFSYATEISGWTFSRLQELFTQES